MTIIKDVFDYGSIDEKQKNTIEEVAKLAREMDNHMFAEFILHRFKVEEQKKYDLKKSKFYNLCKENDIRINVQGYLQDGIDKDSIQYPMISITEDIRKLDAFIEKIK